MRDSVARILLALASSDATRTDLKDFLRWLDQAGLDRAMETVRDLQTLARDSERELGRGLLSEGSIAISRSVSEKQLVSRVEKLMLESGLSKVSTVKVTTDLLKQRGYPPRAIPEANKIAFRVWIERLVRQIPPEDLLSVATAVRNHAVHGNDWPLRRDKP